MLVEERRGLVVHPGDELLEGPGLHPPLAATADLDRGQLLAAHQGVDLGAGGVEDLRDVGELEEPGRGSWCVHVSHCATGRPRNRADVPVCLWTRGVTDTRSPPSWRA